MSGSARVLDMSLERRLVNRITSADRVWVSLLDCGLPRDQVDTIAAKYGKEVVWQCTDHIDQLLLIAEPGKLPLRTRSRFTPRAVLGTLPWVLAGLTIAGVAVTNGLGYAVVASNVGIFGALPTVFAMLLPRMLPRSIQIALLAREFNGASAVKITQAHYTTSFQMIGYLAATYGYRYTGSVTTRSGTMLYYATDILES